MAARDSLVSDVAAVVMLTPFRMYCWPSWGAGVVSSVAFLALDDLTEVLFDLVSFLLMLLVVFFLMATLAGLVSSVLAFTTGAIGFFA